MADDDEILRAEISGSEDEEEDERKHNQLVDAISSLDGKNRHKLSQRTVLTSQISEFNFATSGEGGGKVRLHELVGTLKDTAKLGNLKKQLGVVNKKKKIVAVPLPKHEKQKIDRTVAYESTSKDISRWDSVIDKNRLAEQLQFPLQKPDFTLATTDDFVKRFQARTPLEMQVAALLKGSDNVIQDKKQELTPAEQRALRAMDVQEARERHAELMKYKALLSYQEAKARWRKKIKSKRYHRMLKKDRLKQEKKQLDNLEKNDPEGYTEKLKQLERDRVKERMSLKHRGGSKFARKQMIYAKYDDRAREQVQDMLQKSRELTKKMEVDVDSGAESEGGVSLDSDDEIRMAENQLHSERDDDNPWMAKVNPVKKNNPWMTKLKAKSGPMYSKPKELKNTLAEVENEPARGTLTAKVSNSVSEKEDIMENDSGLEASLSYRGGSSLEIDCSYEGKTEIKDELDKVFSTVSKKTKTNKTDSKMKGKGKIVNKKKQKSTVEKTDNKNDLLSERNDTPGVNSEKEQAKNEKSVSEITDVNKNESVFSGANLSDQRDGRFESDNNYDSKNETKEDEIDKIFSNASKKSKSNKITGRKKGTGKKKNKKKQISIAEKTASKNDSLINSNDAPDENSEKEQVENEKTVDNADEDEELISESLSRKRTLAEIEDLSSDDEIGKPKKARSYLEEESKGKKKTVDREACVDPKKLFTLDSKLKQVGAAPDLVDEDEGELDPEEQQRMTIAQAFADDDVVEEFQQDKRADIDKNKPKDIDLTLPGWGEWGGAGIVVSKRKKKRFRIKAPPEMPRRDMHLGNVIINEQKAPAVSKHQVNQLPYPFVSVDQFEKSIRAPLGKQWNPEIAHRELVKPKVVTKLGKIITPMDKSEVFKNPKKSGFKSDLRFNEQQKKDLKTSGEKKKHFKDKKSKTVVAVK